jgi:hypothetical protein
VEATTLDGGRVLTAVVAAKPSAQENEPIADR